MRERINFRFIYILLVLFISCDEDNSKLINQEDIKKFNLQPGDKIEEVESYSLVGGKTIKEKYYLLNDSLYHKERKMYDDEENLLMIIEYERGDRHGSLRKFYPKSGKLRILENYTNHVLTDTVRMYYETGELERTIPIWKGQKQGIALNYFKNGKIKAYIHFSNNEVKYRVDYNSDGSILKEGGTAIPIVYINKIELDLYEELVIDYQIYSPPHANSDFYVGWTESNKKSIQTWSKVDLETDNYFMYKNHFKEVGSYIVGAYVISNAVDTTAMSKDYFQVEVVVK